MNNKRYSLLIGVNGYRQAIGPLRFCVSDVKRIESVLDLHKGGFVTTYTTLLTDDQSEELQPTRSHIIENVISICNNTTNEDTLLIHFSGHGKIGDDNRLYLLPLDTSGTSIEETAIAWQLIMNRVERASARNKIIILDACHSGAGRNVAPDTSFKVVEELKQSGGGCVCLTSCSGGEISYELPELEMGLFSHYLVDGINGAADQLGRGIIDVESLYNFVRDRTIQHAQQIRVEQVPYLISKVSAPLNTFIIAAKNIVHPINRVLVLTENPPLGLFLVTGIKLNDLAQDAIWIKELEQASTDAQKRFNYDAVYLDVQSNWGGKKEFISLIRRKYPRVPFVLVGIQDTFLQGLEEEDKRRFRHYYFFDLRRSMAQAPTLISDTLAQVGWYIKMGL